LIRGNKVYRNGFGLHRNGISLGHKDTDNIIEENHIYENAKHGIYFRSQTESNGAHRNIIRNSVGERDARPLKDVVSEVRKFWKAEVEFWGI